LGQQPLFTSLANLSVGANPNKKCVLKLLGPLPSHSARLHHSFAVADGTGTVVALALYGKATALLNPSAHGSTIEVRIPYSVYLSICMYDIDIYIDR